MSSSTDYTTNFPHATLTAIQGTPTFASVQLLKQECFANAASVESSITAPDLGHSVLVIGDAEYNALATAALGAAFAFAAPARPPAQPVFTGANTNVALSTAKADWYRQTNDWNAYNGTKTALKKQILAAIPTEFVSSLKDDTTGFAAVTPLQIIEHVTQFYGTVTRADLDANLTKLESPWEPTESMEGLWTRCTSCVNVANAGGEPIQDAHKIRIMLKVLTATGLFSLDIRDWNKRLAPERTWNHFKTFFANANRERCANMTAGDYRHQAHAAVVGGRSGATSPTFSEITQASTFTEATATMKDVKYCWSHGLYPRGNGHTSKECQHKRTGHKEDATMFNMQGGNNSIRRTRGEINDYARLNRPNDKEGGNRDSKKDRNAKANSAKASQDTINEVAKQVLAQITGSEE